MAPRITINCDCGEAGKVAYGERYACACGRSYSTDSVPAADYEKIRALDARYRRVGWVAGGVFAAILLVVILTRPLQLLMITPGTMMVWFAAIRPFLRRRHWRQVQSLTRSWKIRPESAS